MMKLYRYSRGALMQMVPRFPVYRGKISCGAANCGNGMCKKSCGMNLILVEEILAGIQARVCLYLMTPEKLWKYSAIPAIVTNCFHLVLIQLTFIVKTGFNLYNMYTTTCDSGNHIYRKLLVHSSGYAARAFSSIDTENVHMLLNHYDRRGVRCSSVSELQKWPAR